MNKYKKIIRQNQKPPKNSDNIKLIKDLNEAENTSKKQQKLLLIDMECYIACVINHFDEIKKKQIKEADIIKKIKEKNINYNINNNLIYNPLKNDVNNQNNSEYILNYELPEYRRPDNYITYTPSLKNDVKRKTKEYEANEDDKIYLNLRNNFMKLEELENVLIDLENNCISEKEEKIDEEMAIKIIQTKYSKYIKYTDSLINHFKYKRKKKSLLRKNWHINKCKDEYLNGTFQKRPEYKRETRKKPQNKKETLNNLKDEETFSKNNDKMNKEELIFQSNTKNDCCKITKEQEKTETANSSGKNQNSDNNNLLVNNNSNNNENINIIHNNMNIILNQKEEINSVNNSLHIDIKNENNNSLDIFHNIPENINQNKENAAVALNTFIEKNIISLNEEENNNIKQNQFKKSDVRIRIRKNGINQIVVDRYIQDKNSFNPFDDDFNNLISNFSNYTKNESDSFDCNIFDKLYRDYNSNKLKYLRFVDDNVHEDVSTNFEEFSNASNQFLQSKRNRPKNLSN